ncbi:MAG: hypothetical protein PVI90_01135 [Desulfobacteraceae bacterium]|jgi:hypothetical protein
MDNYNDRLQRVVTVGSSDPFKMSFSRNLDTVALIFYNRKRNITRDEQITLMLHEEIRNVFNDFYYGVSVKNELNPYTMFYIVSCAHGLRVLKNDHHPFFLIRKGFVFETTLKNIHNQCKLMQKWTYTNKNGCQCSWKRDRCIHTWHTQKVIACDLDNNSSPPLMGLSASWDSHNVVPPDIFQWANIKHKNKIEYWKSTIADYTLIPYLATTSNPTEPIERTYDPFECNFTNIEIARDALSKRGRAAGKNTKNY